MIAEVIFTYDEYNRKWSVKVMNAKSDDDALKAFESVARTMTNYWFDHPPDFARAEAIEDTGNYFITVLNSNGRFETGLDTFD